VPRVRPQAKRSRGIHPFGSIPVLCWTHQLTGWLLMSTVTGGIHCGVKMARTQPNTLRRMIRDMTDSWGTARTIEASAIRLWGLLKEFGENSWMGVPVEVDGLGPGAIRQVHVGDKILHERCDFIDDEAMSVGYTVIAGDVGPCENYRATMTVTALTPETCELSWVATYDPVGVSTAMPAVLAVFFPRAMDVINSHLTKPQIAD
jgi:Polyketide cyclase / dehydrase and lipid transport